MPGRSLIKRARSRSSIGAWLAFGTGSAIPWGKPECRLTARSATLPGLRAALIAGNESGRGSVTHRADHVTRPSMVQRDQRNHFPPPVLTGWAPLGSQRLGHPVHPRRSQYILYHTTITFSHPFLPRLCPRTSTAGESLQTGLGQGGSRFQNPEPECRVVVRMPRAIYWRTGRGPE